MKVIDLLNKIANEEEVPRKIKYDNIYYCWCNLCKIYERIEDTSKGLYDNLDNLNDEVEIIKEDKKIEELPMLDYVYETKSAINQTRRKINEIIEVINESNSTSK